MKVFKRKRRWVAVATVVAVILGGSAGAWALTRPKAAVAAAATTSLVAATVSTMTQSVSTTGTIQPARRSDLSFTVAGTVTKVSASVGQTVKKGRVLATVDSTTLQTVVDTATAGVTSAEEQVTNVASSTTAQIAAAAAQLAQAKSQLATAKDNLAAASLKAPFDGVVAAVGLAAGDTVGSTAGSSTGSSTGTTRTGTGTTTTATTTTGVITLISTDAWVVNANVGSADLGQLKKGLQAQITPTGSTTRIFGTIASIGIIASSSTSGSATFPVVINVTGNPAGLYAGGSADVSLIVKQVPDVLTVPTQAIATVNGATVVREQVNGATVDVPVTVGTSYGALTEITKGIAEGDKVVVTFAGPGGAGGNRGNRGAGAGTGGAPAGGAPAGGAPAGGGGFGGGLGGNG
ncbi:MAG: HlyD family efflux transporter periplasmic adaptor subunit [Frankiales bacterium]|nr:HlyD family efflux transporter periplasmic adaptor subunit [Frankiales bacterium]